MCGIFGINGNSVTDYTELDLSRAIESLSKRGPDEKKVVTLPKCILGQTRLSIVDISGGRQPMKDNSSENTIVFNGEIYNYKELKENLEAKGHIFSTKSDTEVILKAFTEYGVDCPKYLDGMFAFVIWDPRQQSLYIARDRFGKKPLYYTYDNKKNFLFASEIKTFFATEKIKGCVDYSAIDDYLSLMYIPPWKTIYSNIYVIPPASYAVYSNSTLTVKKYWQLEKKPVSLTYNEAKEGVRRLLTSAVEKRMIADVEIGSFLSGGVDSTLVTLLAQNVSEKPIKTFSVGYQQHIDELPFALEASVKIKSEHYTLQAKDTDVGELHKVLAYFDEPHADSSDFPQYLVSKLARTKVKVALSGDGADELFLGYGWYTRHKNLSYRAHFMEKVFMNPFSGFINAIQIFSQSERNKLWKEQHASGKNIICSEVKNSKLPSNQKINLFDLTTYLPGQLMVKADRMSMMNSLEVRSPFLDHHLAEFVYNLPDDFKTDSKNYKIILKDILSEYMPEKFVYRRKQGFGAPVKIWLRKSIFRDDVYEKLSNNDCHIYMVMHETYIKKMLDDFYINKDDSRAYKIWVLYCLEIWFKEHHKFHQK